MLCCAHVAISVVKSLPVADGARAVGLACLGDELFVLRDRWFSQIEVYSTKSAEYYRLRQFSIKGLNTHACNDMTSCARHRCLYVSDWTNKCVHKSKHDGVKVASWYMFDHPYGLSLTPQNSLLVTCHDSRKLLELSTANGECIRQVELHSDIQRPWHALQLANQLYVVAHDEDQLSRVCVVNAGGHASLSYGGHLGSDVTKFNLPCHVTVDISDFIFVADRNNQRVTLLSPGLELIRHIELNQKPWRLYLDRMARRLYVSHTDSDVTVVQV